jgi:hypothetical protein
LKAEETAKNARYAAEEAARKAEELDLAAREAAAEALKRAQKLPQGLKRLLSLQKNRLILLFHNQIILTNNLMIA